MVSTTTLRSRIRRTLGSALTVVVIGVSVGSGGGNGDDKSGRRSPHHQ